MKIAYCLPDKIWIDAILDDHPKDAAHIQQKYIAEGLMARGHSLTFIAPTGLEEVVCANGTHEVQAVSGTWTESGCFRFFRKAAWRLQQVLGIPYLNVFSNYQRMDVCQQILQGFQLVFERNSLYNVGVARACKKLRLPYIMFFDADQIAELDFIGRPLKGWLLWRARNLLRENLEISRWVICVSEVSKDQLIRDWSVPADKILVIPNGVDIQRFRPDPRLRAETRASLQLSRNPLIIFVGSFYPWHDIRILLDAFEMVLKSCSDARLILVGHGTDYASMVKHTADLDLEQHVQFTGFVTHDGVSDYINAADIAVVPIPLMKQILWLSPMKLFEYMASGKAIVATRVGQVAKVVKNEENGLLVPAGEARAMADAIIRLISDRGLRTRLGQQARDDAIRNHSWDQYISQLECVFETTFNLPVNATGPLNIVGACSHVPTEPPC